jgi:hypothetical protein
MHFILPKSQNKTVDCLTGSQDMGLLKSLENQKKLTLGQSRAC